MIVIHAPRQERVSTFVELVERFTDICKSEEAKSLWHYNSVLVARPNLRKRASPHFVIF